MTAGNELTAEETILSETEENASEAEVLTEPNPLEAEIKTLREQLALKDESYKGLQRKVNQVTEELKQRGLSEARLDGLEQTQRLLFAAIAEREGVDINEISQEKKTDYLKKADEIVAEQKNKAQQLEFVAKVREYQARAEALKMDTESEEYLEIRDLVVDGKFDRAERKLAKLEAKRTEPEAKIDLETERAKIREEEKRKILIERGELNAETGQPAGSGRKSVFTADQIADREFYEAHKADIMDAYREGRIKK